MTLQDIFYLTMILSAVVVTATMIYIAYLAVNTLRLLQSLLRSVKETGENLSVVKEGLEFGVLTLASRFLSKLRGGGEQNGKE